MYTVYIYVMYVSIYTYQKFRMNSCQMGTYCTFCVANVRPFHISTCRFVSFSNGCLVFHYRDLTTNDLTNLGRF